MNTANKRHHCITIPDELGIGAHPNPDTVAQLEEIK